MLNLHETSPESELAKSQSAGSLSAKVASGINAPAFGEGFVHSAGDVVVHSSPGTA
jgi:hypothetical protein